MLSIAHYIMLSGTNIRVKYKLSEAAPYLLEKFSPMMSKEQVADYYGTTEAAVIDLTNIVCPMHENMQEMFPLGDNAFWKPYLAPIIVKSSDGSNQLKYILIVKDDSNVDI